jgi:hypothetical protein
VPRSAWLLVACVWLWPALAHAQEDPAKKEACIQSHAESQKLRRDGKLIRARELLLECASEACPAPIRAECGEWAQQVEAGTPSILVEVTGADGSPRSDVEVWVDGERRSQTITGMPIAVDPGSHEIEVRPTGAAAQRRRVLLSLDEKRSRVAFQIAKRAPQRRASRQRSEPASKGIPTASVLLGSLGLVALGAGGYFGYRAKTRADELESCKPSCDRDEADAMRAQALVADISLGVGVVALGVAAYVWLSQGDTDEAARAARAGFAF